MENEILCANCGHEEHEHRRLVRVTNLSQRNKILNSIEDSREIIDGYTVSLEECKEYVPEDPKGYEEFQEERQGRTYGGSIED